MQSEIPKVNGKRRSYQQITASASAQIIAPSRTRENLNESQKHPTKTHEAIHTKDTRTQLVSRSRRSISVDSIESDNDEIIVRQFPHQNQNRNRYDELEVPSISEEAVFIPKKGSANNDMMSNAVYLQQFSI